MVVKGGIPWNKGKSGHLSEETRAKMTASQLGHKSWNKGKSGHLSKEVREKMSKALKGRVSPTKDKSPWNKGKKLSKEHCAKVSKANTGKKRTDKHRENYRLSSIRRIETRRKEGIKISPNVGRHETEILDSLELSNNIIISRQHPVAGYYLDGYCGKLNLAIEIDEAHHKNQLAKDKSRENIIKQRLNCEFMRIEG